MNKRIWLLPSSDEYVAFVDFQNENNLYCMTRDMLKEKQQKMHHYDREEEVPSEFTIKAFPMVKVSEKDSFTDNYDIELKTPIDFPINRIKWIFIQLVHA